MAPNAWGQELSPIKNIVSRKAEYPWMLRSPLLSRDGTYFWIAMPRSGKLHTSLMPLFDLEEHILLNFGKLPQIRVKPRYSYSVNSCDHFWIFRHFCPARTQYSPSIHQLPVGRSVTKSVGGFKTGRPTAWWQQTEVGPTVLGLGACGEILEIYPILRKITLRIVWRHCLLNLRNI